MKFTIRPATTADAEAVAAIYAPYADTHITFEYPAPDAGEMARRIADTTGGYPWLVCESGGEIFGYAYAHRFRTRAAFDWATELSVYLAPKAKGFGMGEALYRAVIDILREQNYVNAVGVVATPNPPSERLHERLGFELLFNMESIGWKLGAWRDMAYYMLRLNPIDAEPAPVVPYPELDAAFVRGVCEKYAASIKEA